MPGGGRRSGPGPSLDLHMIATTCSRIVTDHMESSAYHIANTTTAEPPPTP